MPIAPVPRSWRSAPGASSSPPAYGHGARRSTARPRSPRQRQIAELAAAGKGNRAIARELFLSVKTVETHLASAYRMLGVGHRHELAASLATWSDPVRHVEGIAV